MGGLLGTIFGALPTVGVAYYSERCEPVGRLRAGRDRKPADD